MWLRLQKNIMVMLKCKANLVTEQRLSFIYRKNKMNKIKIFYLEDEPFLAKIVKESLEVRGFEVIMENEGNNAIASFKRAQPAICVLDIMLPNKDGFAIA